MQGLRGRSLQAIELNTYGGMKVNASLGLSFTSFFDRPQAYSIRDSLIIGDAQDMLGESGMVMSSLSVLLF